MSAAIIACLSQKGGVGKSTLARLIARNFAEAKWRVKIADLNVKQKTAVDWAALRLAANITPEVPAEAFNAVRQALRQDYDLIVFDGKPDSDTTTLDCAKEATLVVIPTAPTLDDLKPQVLFAHELVARGIAPNKLVFVLNKCGDSEIAILDAKTYIQQAGYKCAQHTLPMKVGYQIAQNQGKAITETTFPSLNASATALVQEIASYGLN